MASGEMLLFQKALWEASANVYERELSECEQDVKCSRRHYAKMRKIIGVAMLPATTHAAKIKRRIVAALIAAALLLTGCATYAYREEIKELIEIIFEDHVEVKYKNDDDPATEATISVYYTLGYVPEGYELLTSFETSSKVKRDWGDSAGYYIVFEQYHVDSTLFAIDDEVEGWEIVNIGNQEVKTWFAGVYFYMWNDGEYIYRLVTSIQWEEKEMLRMIENLQIKNNKNQ